MKVHLTKILLSLFLIPPYFHAWAANPLLPLDQYIPDVEARVYTNEKGQTRLYLYGSQDEYPPSGWCSFRYKVFSAPIDNLENWTDHGVSFSSKPGQGYIWKGVDSDGISWSDGRLYAPDVIKFEGKYWLASCLSEGGLAISVSDTPEGPFSPGVKIVYDDDNSHLKSIDPALYEENGRLYLLWGQTTHFGGEGLVGVELEKDGDGIYSIAKRTSKRYLFGTKDEPDQGFGFYEGASIRKINGRYYVLYASNKGRGVHMMSYAISDHPLGPYTFGGNILDSDGIDKQGGNNHGSLCEINGQWYIFYHRGFNGNMSRKVCVERITVNSDGSIDPVEMTNHGFGGPLSPYQSIEAAYLTRVRLPGFASTAHLDELKPNLHPLVNLTNKCCIEFRDFDFGTGNSALTFIANVMPKEGGVIELVLDDPSSKAIGKLVIKPSKSASWQNLSTKIPSISGIHTLYLRFSSKHEQEIVQLSRFIFKK